MGPLDKIKFPFAFGSDLWQTRPSVLVACIFSCQIVIDEAAQVIEPATQLPLRACGIHDAADAALSPCRDCPLCKHVFAKGLEGRCLRQHHWLKCGLLVVVEAGG